MSCLETREKNLVLSQTVYARADNVSLNGTEKVLMQALPFWEADPFCHETKTGKNIHIAVIRKAELEFDEQMYLLFDIYVCIYIYLLAT